MPPLLLRATRAYIGKGWFPMPNERTIPRICEQCGAHFLAYPGEVKRGFAKFCSRACFFARHTAPKNHLCPQCGNPFAVNPRSVVTGAFCSRRCYLNARRNPIIDASPPDGIVRILLGSRTHPRMVALVDEADYPLVSQYDWCAHRYRDTYYVQSSVNGATVHLHRLIMQPPDDLLVDHIDFNGLNCTRTNMRLATHTQNLIHQRRETGRSAYRGVTQRENGTWRVRISDGQTRINLGTFATAEEAARTYDEAAIRLHGAFANTNY